MFDHEVYVIRIALPGDIESLIELCAEHAAYEEVQYDPQDKDIHLAGALFTASPRLYAWVVEQHGRLMGYATATEEFSTWDADAFLHMDCLYLREEVRGAGLGRRLIREIASLALQLGCVNVQWQTPLWNAHAISFYQHLGAEGKQKVRFFFAADALETFLE
ncbi:N-acetyltransferase [Dictyobacter alpinus]|uniref:N-acetyltransferase n=1 Tax=Dictyobacter alpinus TaxID=2014873 RepID=A0A402BEM1_9CHLR|nr:GNAT family N-acetyltransferase [Dictyobacter alpinus]GCE29881.1 N-acetyltransferase [Dictyobacter alpinus]